MSVGAAVAAIMFVGIIAYTIFGGADFGSGLWDLTAGDAARGAKLRTLIDHSIGPVWEANHIWLIFVLVYLWTGFPAAFAAICETLFVPLSLAGLGIVARGSAFAFRKFAPAVAQARLFGALFALSSIVTPFLFGTIVGAVASGRVPLDGTGDRWSSWTSTTSLIGGVLAVATTSFLAAVFLTREAQRTGDDELYGRCRKRALGSGAVTGVLSLIAVAPLHADAPHLFRHLNGRALPLLLVAVLAGTTAIVTVWTNRADVARVAAVAAVGAVVAGWGVAQYPWVLVDTARIEDVAGNDATMWGLVVVFLIAGVTVVPALVWMLWLTQRPAWAADPSD
ncbi:MAG: cytochrome d ubiquinol oxidase subunit II [Acidimicrobiia bacterium]